MLPLQSVITHGPNKSGVSPHALMLAAAWIKIADCSTDNAASRGEKFEKISTSDR